jgi:uncharacterized protein (DUF849 family)
MGKRTILTCAVTGNLTQPGMNEHLPITPQQIAEAALEAADAGAAAVHIHVRHPESGLPSMELQHYRECVDIIRERNSVLIINLTTGPGARFQPSDHDPRVPGPRTTLTLPSRRVEHVVTLRPDVASLDLNTMIFGGEIMMNTPASIREMASSMYRAGVTPELELFHDGDIQLAKDLLADGSIRRPLLASLVLGVKYGFEATTRTMAHAAAMLPPEMEWTAFGIGRQAFPMVAQSWLLGGNIRIGMEDTVKISRDHKAKSNGELVAKARGIIEALGGELASSEEARERIGLGSSNRLAARR